VFQSTQLNSTGSSLLRIRLSVSRSGEGKEVFNDLSINLGSTNVLAEMISDADFQQITYSGLPATKAQFSSITLGTRNYANVLAAYRDTTVNKQPGIYQIYFAKNVGLIGYAEYPSKKLWVKQ
jgi:hypothetical protein